MKIAHIALWTNRLDEMRDFYVKYFNGKSNLKYTNETKGFESYFIYFENSDVSLEIMRRKDIQNRANTELLGYCHLAFTLGSKELVLEMTERFRADGYTILGEPRTSGDGYFESVIADIDGNRVELLA